MKRKAVSFGAVAPRDTLPGDGERGLKQAIRAPVSRRADDTLPGDGERGLKLRVLRQLLVDV